MNTRSSFSSNPIVRALASRTALALGLSLPLLGTWGCGSSAALDNYSCSCSVTDTGGNITTQSFAYCGTLGGGSAEVSGEENATSWADDTCEGKNPSSTCDCACTDLGTTCTTPS
jgi:hypothetical protein